MRPTIKGCRCKLSFGRAYTQVMANSNDAGQLQNSTADDDSPAIRYHAEGRPGKIEVVATKPLASQRDLSHAYTPGVAEACLAIADEPEEAFRLTARGNLVAVVTNGTAVLGLGNIGALAGKPVMEG